jgi:hypothetical protein
VKAAWKARSYDVEVPRPREQPEVLDSPWQILEGR